MIINKIPGITATKILLRNALSDLNSKRNPAANKQRTNTSLLAKSIAIKRKINPKINYNLNIQPKKTERN